jgi:hypothetical protein
MGVKISNNLPKLAQTMANAMQSLFDESAEHWIQQVTQDTPNNAIGQPYVKEGWYITSASGMTTYSNAVTRLLFVSSSLRTWFHADPTEWFVLSPARWFHGIPTEWWLSPRIVPQQPQPPYPGVTLASATEWTAMNEVYGIPFIDKATRTLTLADSFEEHWRRESGA